MVRLIDADALDAEMYHKSFEVDDGRNVWNSGLWIRYKIFEEAIRDAPTVDAVPAIRCKDCKHQRKEYHEDKRRKDGGYNIYWCELVDGYAPLGFDDEYCAWAERKEE